MIKEAITLLKDLLENAVMTQLATTLQIPVEIPTSIEGYKLSHPIGAYLIVYKGSQFKQKDIVNIVAQDRDIEIMVVVTARYRAEFTPEEYLDFAIDVLSGYQMNVYRADRLIRCVSDEWLGEDAGIWSYSATFLVPSEFFQKNLSGSEE